MRPFDASPSKILPLSRQMQNVAHERALIVRSYTSQSQADTHDRRRKSLCQLLLNWTINWILIKTGKNTSEDIRTFVKEPRLVLVITQVEVSLARHKDDRRNCLEGDDRCLRKREVYFVC